MNDDLIRRQDVIELIDRLNKNRSGARKVRGLSFADGVEDGYMRIRSEVSLMPSAERDYKLDEWCTDCKEYDKEKHCCPRFNAVIRSALKEMKAERKEK